MSLLGGACVWQVVPTLEDLPEEQINCEPPQGARFLPEMEVKAALLADGNCECEVGRQQGIA